MLFRSPDSSTSRGRLTEVTVEAVTVRVGRWTGFSLGLPPHAATENAKSADKRSLAAPEWTRMKWSPQYSSCRSK